MQAPQYKMIALDLDGTLLAPNGEVTPRTKAALHACLRSGMLVCFATGRNWTESKMVLDAVEHYATAVFVGGAMVIDTGRQVTLHKAYVEQNLAREVCRVLEEAGHAVLALQDTQDVDYLVSDEIPLNPETDQWMRMTRATVHRIKNLPEHSHANTVRLGIVAHPEEVARVKRQLSLRFAERIMVQNLYVPTANVDVLEIFDPSVNKWEGIKLVARRHNIADHDIVAVGDDWNDLSMIEHAGLGVAMGNARPEIKKLAKRVIGTNQEDGLAAFLEELVAHHSVRDMTSGGAAA